MFWEETVELIKTHQHPTPVYEYKGGTLKTSYIDIEDFPITLRWRINKYLKYDLTDLQLFCSLGASEGIGSHTDPCNVLIICLEGEMAYSVEGMPPVVLQAGDTIYISRGLRHLPISSTVPRICLSAEARGYVPREEVTHYFG